MKRRPINLLNNKMITTGSVIIEPEIDIKAGNFFSYEPLGMQTTKFRKNMMESPLYNYEQKLRILFTIVNLITSKERGYQRTTSDSLKMPHTYIPLATNMNHCKRKENKIKRYFKQRQGGLIASPKEEMMQTQNLNHATFYYLKESNEMKQRKLEEEKLITDYVSERDAFNFQHNKFKRLQQNNDLGQQKEAKELCQIELKDFIKDNRINPKIFTVDQAMALEKPLPTVKNLKHSSNTKHNMIQKSVMLIQTSKIAQARHFLIQALKQFPDDVPLLFNKGLVHYLNKEYQLSIDIFLNLKNKLNYKNAVLINLFLNYLQIQEFEKIIELTEEIEVSENFLDFDEKNLKKMYYFGREKMKLKNYEKYEEHMKIVKQKRLSLIGKENASTNKKNSMKSNRTHNSRKVTLKTLEALVQEDVQMFDSRQNYFMKRTYSQKYVHGRKRFGVYSPLNMSEKSNSRKKSAHTEQSIDAKENLAHFIIKKQRKKIQQKITQERETFEKLSEKYGIQDAGKRKDSSQKGQEINFDIMGESAKKKKLKEGFRELDKYVARRKESGNEDYSKYRDQDEQSKRKSSTHENGNDLQEVLTSLKKSLREQQVHFKKQINKEIGVDNEDEDKNRQMDPIQQEFNSIQEEIENFKQELGGEQQLFDFIEKLKQEKQNSKGKKNIQKDKTYHTKGQKTSYIQLAEGKYKQYSRVIYILLEQKLKSQKTLDNSMQRRSQSRNQQAFLSNTSSRNSLSVIKMQQQMRRNSDRKDALQRIKSGQREMDLIYKSDSKSSQGESDDHRLMRILGLTKEQLAERKKLEMNLTQHMLITENEKKAIKLQQEQENLMFDKKTKDFLEFLFENYGIQEAVVPGTEKPNALKDFTGINKINNYINNISSFVTARSSDISNLNQRRKTSQNEKSHFYKRKSIDMDQSHASERSVESRSSRGQAVNEIENFSKFLELKVVENMSEQRFEEGDFYKALLQKLNAIEILQIYLKKCVESIRSNEESILKKELSFAMLQIFREQISKREILERQRRTMGKTTLVDDVDYGLIDKIVKRLKFFRTFDSKVRQKLYRICRYQIVPPNRMILRKEEIDQYVMVLVHGTASLMVKDNEQDIIYSVHTLFPGESLGDLNLQNTLKYKEDQTQIFVKSDKECDLLVFERKEFAQILFQEMKDSLYEKIVALKNSEFFENISPYALVVLCSNVTIREFSYGDVIARQEKEPEFCYIILSGECKVAYETIVYKTRDEINGLTKTNQPHFTFGQQSYNPDEKYGALNDNQKVEQLKKGLEENSKEQFQKILNDKFSFQNERLYISGGSLNNQSPGSSLPMIQSSPSKMGPMMDFVKKPAKQNNQLIAYRHHIFFDKLVQGKSICSRALLEKDAIKKYIEREFVSLKDSLQLDRLRFQKQLKEGMKNQYQKQSQKSKIMSSDSNSIYQKGSSQRPMRVQQNDYVSSFQGRSLVDSQVIQEEMESDTQRLEMDPLLKDHLKDKQFYKHMNAEATKQLKISMKEKERKNKEDKERDEKEHRDRLSEMEKLLNEERENALSQEQRESDSKLLYDALMQSQLTVIADSSVVKVIEISRKSKKYLSEPLKQVIDNKIISQKFKDYDRPFLNKEEVAKFIENDKQWDSYKSKISHQK